MRSGIRPWWALALLLWAGGATAAEPVTLAEVRVEHREERLPLTGTITARRGALLSTAVAGQVTDLKVDLGDSVAGGDTLLALDAELNRLARDSARAAAEEALAARDDARRRLDEASITAIVPVNDPDSRTFLLRARVADPPPMTPGMSARATLVLRGDTASLAVPRDALVRYPDGRVTVWVAESRDGTLLAREQRLRVGPGLGDRVTVLEGLSAGDRVVVRGNESLSDGRELEVRRPHPPNGAAPE